MLVAQDVVGGNAKNTHYASSLLTWKLFGMFLALLIF